MEAVHVGTVAFARRERLALFCQSMSRERRPPLVSLVAMTRPVVGYAEDFPTGHVIRRHRHAAGQLIYAASGVMTITPDEGRWVVPPLGWPGRLPTRSVSRLVADEPSGGEGPYVMLEAERR